MKASMVKTALRNHGWVPLLASGLVGGVFAVWQWRRRREESLAGQVAVITGGSRGLGFLIADELGRRGCHLVLAARDPIELARARHRLLGHGTDVHNVVCDVAQPAEVEQLIDDVLARHGRIDVLVNNAGIIQVGPFESFTLSDFRKALAVNFLGAVHTVLAVAPHMRSRGTGRIVNVASIGGKVAVPHLLPYDAAKFALVGFSEGLHAELARDGVSVTTVIPGLMRTGSEAFAEPRTAGDKAWFSVAARLPGLSMNPRHAARRIVAALARRDTEVVLGPPAKLLKLFHTVFPSLSQALLGFTNRFLPQAAPGR
ncbi:MAG TPA: SDR family NAD(P)-dependent oxidoreductase [Polyangia bacterium]|jgi:short-subunit dehydrogenase|nr:SDR family NAD(P)-dependent oxidoreductase [Polyangia bacterium]